MDNMSEKITRRTAVKIIAKDAAALGITLAAVGTAKDAEAGYCYSCGACEKRSLKCYTDEHDTRFRYVQQYQWNSSGYCCGTVCRTYRGNC
jgi:hypothetical protein